jgi:hypothetical protein
MKFTIVALVLVLLLGACAQAPAPTATPAPTDTPLPTPNAAATTTAVAATVQAEMEANLTATAQAEKAKQDAIATAVQATDDFNSTATAVAQATSAQATAVKATANANATATVRAGWTPTSTPTKTPPPTATRPPQPTNTPGPSPTPRPPDTAVPPTAPPSALSAGFTDMRYESWGRPQGGCGAFNDNDPVRKFNVNVTVTNNGSAPTGLWGVVAYDSNGNRALACFYFYGDWSVAPGQSKSVTWAAFTDNGTYIRQFTVIVLDQQNNNEIGRVTQCFGPNGELSGC